MLANCIYRFSISSPFSVTFHPSCSEKQAGNFDNPSCDSQACDWISVITSVPGLLETCQKVCSPDGSVKNCSGLFPCYFWSLAQYRRRKGRRKVWLKNTNFPLCLGTVSWDLNSSKQCITPLCLYEQKPMLICSKGTLSIFLIS